MIDSSGETREPIAPQDPIQHLKNEIEKASGEPIKLKKKTRAGESLFLQVLSVDYEPDSLGKRNTTWINILVKKNNELIPIAGYYWLIEGNTAIGGFIDPPPLRAIEKFRELNNRSFQRALDFYREGNFTTLSKYRRLGIGSFMTATAIAMMDQKGATELAGSVLLKDAVHVWKKFGVVLDSLDPRGSAIRERMPIVKVLHDPQTAKIISEFI